MRMFLVVMCDMFLLLYLTALAQIESTPVSKLTVHDYIALKKSEEEIRKLAEEREKRLADSAQESKSIQIDLKAALEKLRETERMNASLRESAKGAESAKIDLLKQRDEERAKSDAIRAEREREAASARQRALELQAAIEKTKAESLEEKAKADELKRLADIAKAEADQARELAKKSEAEALSAKQAEYQAQESARIARLNEENALRTAALSADQAAKAKVEAVRSSLIADRAEKDRVKIREKLNSTTQNADRAYVKNVEGRLIGVSAEVQTKNLLIGRSDRKIRLSGLPVRFDDETIIFTPAEQLGLEPGREPRDYTSFRLSVDGAEVRKVYLSPTKPAILGLVVAKPIPASSPLTEVKNLSGYMPTLLSIRNGSEMNFSDRVRDLDAERFTFQRDRLKSQAGGLLRYEASGFRGTGDFGERIVRGDQIVDLEGSFVGVAVGEGLIRPITGLQGWTEVLLSSGSAEEKVRLLSR